MEQLFNELFREHEKRLFTFIIKIVKSDVQAKDILQDVFLKLWLIRHKLTEVENIGAFLYRLTENKVFDYLRTVANDKKAKEYLWKKMQQSSCEQPDETLENKEYHLIIQRAISQLSPQRKAIYVLSKVEGNKRNAIADELQLSPTRYATS